MTDEGGAEGRTRRKRSRRTTLPIILVALAVVGVTGVGAYAYFAGWIGGPSASDQAALQAGIDAYNRGEYPEAESQLSDLVAGDAGDLEARAALALALSAQGKNDEAIAQYAAIVKADDSNHEAFFQMAILERLIGRTQEALTHLESAADISDETAYLDELARTYLQVGRFEDAIEAWNLALQDESLEQQKKVELLGALADAYSNARQYDEAKRVLEEALFLAPNDENLKARLEALGD